ncbi:glycosyltransferase family 2 protein [Ruminococcus sp.]|uniref:glycosyltransferase family 2 protein n=1 Tax=Ruminococcus sp. TaxID=41978 RepID=UPI0025D77FE4|nr:glycosyltransferase family 2 protein [Ruminococcus sp.]
MDKVSIVLVNYNGDSDTLDCIKSLNKVKYENVEIIVVDNASKTQIELEKRVPDDVVFIKSKENLGFSGGNNLGIKYAIDHGADYVILLNNDTVVNDSFIYELLCSAKRHKNAGLITGKIYFYSQPKHIWYAGGYMNLERARIHHFHSTEEDTFHDEEKRVSFATGCLMMIHKSVIDKIGMLDEAYFMYAEDAEYCARIQKNKYEIWYNPNAIIYHKVSRSSGGGGSKLSQYYRARNEMYLVAHNARHKVIGCMCCAIRLVKRMIVGQFTVKCVYWGLKDCIQLNMGKSNRSF